MEVITHKAKEHHEELEQLHVEIHSTSKADKERMKFGFIFIESILDDFFFFFSFLVSNIRQGQG